MLDPNQCCEKLLYQQLGRLDLYEVKCGEYLDFLKGFLKGIMQWMHPELSVFLCTCAYSFLFSYSALTYSSFICTFVCIKHICRCLGIRTYRWDATICNICPLHYICSFFKSPFFYIYLGFIIIVFIGLPFYLFTFINGIVSKAVVATYRFAMRERA